MSRVIHLRTSNRNIVACYELLARHGLDIKLPISTAVNRVLTAFVEAEIKSARLPDNGPETVVSLMGLYIGQEEKLELPESRAPLVFDSEEAPPEAPVQTHEIDISVIEKAVANASTGGIPAQAPDELPEVPAEAPPWDAFDRFPYKSLQQQAPKDVLIEQAADLPALKYAIEIVYRVIPKEHWGSAKALDMVKPLAGEFQRWIEDHPEDTI